MLIMLMKYLKFSSGQHWGNHLEPLLITPDIIDGCSITVNRLHLFCFKIPQRRYFYFLTNRNEVTHVHVVQFYLSIIGMDTCMLHIIQRCPKFNLDLMDLSAFLLLYRNSLSFWNCSSNPQLHYQIPGLLYGVWKNISSENANEKYVGNINCCS